MNERLNEQISREKPLSLTQYKSSLLHCIPRLRLLAFIVPEKSLTKNLTLAYIERRKNETINEQLAEKAHCLLHNKIHHYCIAYQVLRFLAFIVPERSLTKNLTLAYVERRKNERTNEQISRYTI